MGQPALSLIQVFEKMLKTNKRVAFEGDYKESLRVQYGWGCIIF